MKILVTGADGFIGSHLTEHLLGLGYSVRSFVFYNSFNSEGWLEAADPKLRQRMEVVAGDVRDPNGVRKAVEGCDAVMHLAALIAIPFSYHSPDSYVDTNVKGTLNILNACRELKTKRVLITSTSEVYGTARSVPIDEEHPLQAQSPYAATKIAADQLALSFWRSFGLPVTIVRPFNTYGPRQSARAVIPTVITQALSGFKEIRLGSLSPTRDFVYVKDTVAGFAEILKSEKTLGRVINIATQTEISVGDLAGKILRLTGSRARLRCDDRRLRPVKSEVERLLGSNRNIRTLTRWQPRYSLDRGLKETVSWFKKKGNRARYKPGVYNV
ncbi:MAG TPA: NAD-dependent 4,6-dehydratase LegB [Elusimicrobiota bacterium]|nr:NAD-dependent 4,6-dehydratase LegB [Elusimicrobiota bacterium]